MIEKTTEGTLTRWSIWNFSAESIQDDCTNLDHFRNSSWLVRLRWFIPSIFWENGRIFLGLNTNFFGVLWLSVGRKI